MQSDTPPASQKSQKPAQSAIDVVAYRSLVRLSALIQIAVLVALAASQLLNLIVSIAALYLIVAEIILSLGAIYNIVLWSRVHKKRPQLALQFSLLPLVLALISIVLARGGIESNWYNLYLLMMVCTGIAGLLSVYVTWGITTTFLLFTWLAPRYLQMNITGPTRFELAATLFAGLIAYFVGKNSERALKTMQLSEGLIKQLDSAEMKQQLMMGAIADAVVAVDTERKVVIFNEAAQTITGWDAKSAMGVEYNLIFKLKDTGDVGMTDETDPFLYVLKTGKPLKTDCFSMLDKKNQKISFSISIAPTFDGRGQISGAIAIFHDISDQKQLARERNEFISTASHEMRTPVAAIEGYLSMARNPNLAKVDARAKGFIDKAHDASIHLGTLFRDLLSVTKIEDNRMEIMSRVFNFSELVKAVISEMEIIAKNKGLVLVTHIGTGVGKEHVVAPIYSVEADPDRLREVITNLIDNAIKYSQAGTIAVSVKTVGENVEFAVQDQGIGIAPEEQKHLFQKFYRVNNSYTREIGGTGLGLYLARSLIERFGGRIWVESRLGYGSTFKFSLPLVKQ
ncbi:PAS domain-containing protein [bacterium]|nr:PAS domain-containing protein [bacterium]